MIALQSRSAVRSSPGAGNTSASAEIALNDLERLAGFPLSPRSESAEEVNADETEPGYQPEWKVLCQCIEEAGNGGADNLFTAARVGLKQAQTMLKGEEVAGHETQLASCIAITFLATAALLVIESWQPPDSEGVEMGAPLARRGFSFPQRL